MLRSNFDIIGRGIFCDIVFELENLNVLEFMTDIRGEFVKEFEEVIFFLYVSWGSNCVLLFCV